MDIVGPSDFLALPDERRQAILAEIDRTTQFAYDHAVPVVISRPAHTGDRKSLRSASGFFARVNDGLYLGTADHVWRSFLERRALGEDIIFQAGGFGVPAERTGVVRDPDRDVVFIPISDSEARRSGHTISTSPRGWPPPLPEKGSYVVFSGCPEALRDHASDSHLEFGSFSSIMRVAAASDEHIVCQFEREMWVSDGRRAPPTPGADLSGMSGGPVFSLADPLSMPLIGLIFEFSLNFELLYIRTFTNIRLSDVGVRGPAV